MSNVIISDTDQASEHQLHGYCGWTTIYCSGLDVDHHTLFPGNRLISTNPNAYKNDVD